MASPATDVDPEGGDLREIRTPDPDRWYRNRVFVVLLVTIGVLVVGGAVGVGVLFYVRSRGGAGPQPVGPVDRPYTLFILISSDGFRWDYLPRAEVPNINYLVQNGIRPRSLRPSFPTKTFPNHYTLVTGLYPAHHGIIDNTMYDPEFDAWFHLSDAAAVRDARWWGGEPFWVTCERQGVRAGTYFWPGSEAAIGGVRPSYWLPYNGNTPYDERVRTVLSWIDKPATERPEFITLYMEAVDHAGHTYGPDDDAHIAQAMREVDAAVGQLLDGLRTRGLLNNTNIVFLADHGMTSLSTQRIVQLDRVVNVSDATIVTWYPVLNVRPAPGREQAVYDALNDRFPTLRIFWNDEVPAELNFRDNRRIGRIVGIAENGWAVLSRGTNLGMKGTHGYEQSNQDMHAIFVASGPAFAVNSTMLDAFDNVHVYSLMAHVLGVQPAPTDGNLEAVRSLLR